MHAKILQVKGSHGCRKKNWNCFLFFFSLASRILFEPMKNKKIAWAERGYELSHLNICYSRWNADIWSDTIVAISAVDQQAKTYIRDSKPHWATVNLFFVSIGIQFEYERQMMDLLTVRTEDKWIFFCSWFYITAFMLCSLFSFSQKQVNIRSLCALLTFEPTVIKIID